MYLSSDIRLNMLEYDTDINLKVSDYDLLERIQVIDPSFSLSHAIQNFIKKENDKNSEMYPLFSLLNENKNLSIDVMNDDTITLVKYPGNKDDLYDLLEDEYVDSYVYVDDSGKIIIEGIDANELYRLFATYRNKYDPLTYKFDDNNWTISNRIEAMKEDSAFMVRMDEHDLLYLFNDPVYSSDNLSIPLDSSFSIRDQLRMTIDRVNRGKQIKDKIESMKLLSVYDLYLQMKDKAYTISKIGDQVEIGITTDTPLRFPEGITIETAYEDEPTLEYTLSGDLSIIADGALLRVLHDDYNYNFYEDSIQIG